MTLTLAFSSKHLCDSQFAVTNASLQCEDLTWRTLPDGFSLKSLSSDVWACWTALMSSSTIDLSQIFFIEFQICSTDVRRKMGQICVLYHRGWGCGVFKYWSTYINSNKIIWILRFLFVYSQTRNTPSGSLSQQQLFRFLLMVCFVCVSLRRQSKLGIKSAGLCREAVRSSATRWRELSI